MAEAQPKKQRGHAYGRRVNKCLTLPKKVNFVSTTVTR